MHVHANTHFYQIRQMQEAKNESNGKEKPPVLTVGDAGVPRNRPTGNTQKSCILLAFADTWKLLITYQDCHFFHYHLSVPT